LSLKINQARINLLKKSCCILWNCEEKTLKDGNQLKIKNNGETITVNLFNNGNIQFQGLPKSRFLLEVKDNITKIAKTIEIPFAENENQFIHRAKMLFEYIKTFDLTEEIQRMSAVIISDTSCEVLLRARIAMIAQKKRIPKKDVKLEKRDNMYAFIKKHSYIEVLEEKTHDLRSRRNKLVHQGDIPTILDADFAIDVLTTYLEL